MVYGRLLRSPRPHARILRIDTTKAERLPGVVAVATGADMPCKYGIMPTTLDEYPLAVDKVRYRRPLRQDPHHPHRRCEGCAGPAPVRRGLAKTGSTAMLRLPAFEYHQPATPAAAQLLHKLPVEERAGGVTNNAMKVGRDED